MRSWARSSCTPSRARAGKAAACLAWERLLIRGYGPDDRIVYGTGQVVATAALEQAAGELLARQDVAYLHARSATNNCFQCRIERA